MSIYEYDQEAHIRMEREDAFSYIAQELMKKLIQAGNHSIHATLLQLNGKKLYNKTINRRNKAVYFNGMRVFSKIFIPYNINYENERTDFVVVLYK